MKGRGLFLLFLGLIALLSLHPASSVFAQIALKDCEWERAGGEFLSSATGDLIEEVPPEIEYRTEVTVRCEMNPEKAWPPGSQFVLTTSLADATWRVTPFQGDEKSYFGTVVETKLERSAILLKGRVPVKIQDSVLDLGQDQLKRQIVRPILIGLLAIETSSGGNVESVREFRVSARHPGWVRVKQRMDMLGNEASGRQNEVLDRALAVLSAGYPEMADKILDDVATVERQLDWIRWLLLAIGLVVGAVVGLVVSNRLNSGSDR